MESEITQLKNEIEQLKKEKEQMKMKIERLAVKNAETKMDCIRDEDKSTFIVEINIVEDPDPIKLPVQIYVKYYCSDKPYEEKENVEGKTYYITYVQLPSAQVFAKYAWKRLCEYMYNMHAGSMVDATEKMLIPVYYEHICPELVNDFIPHMIEDFEEILMEEKRKLGWVDSNDNISDSDFEYDDITDSDEYDEDEDEGIDWSEYVDECDEECAPIDSTNISKPAC